MKIMLLLGAVAVMSTTLPEPPQTGGVEITFADFEPEEPIVELPETLPTFQGGDLEHFRRWVTGQIRYPAGDFNVQGRVIVKFIVEHDGSIGPVEILRSPHELLSGETIRVLRLSPAWEPGMQRGEPVRVEFVMPVEFRF